MLPPELADVKPVYVTTFCVPLDVGNVIAVEFFSDVLSPTVAKFVVFAVLATRA
jgi:hypothetical protein